MSTRTFVNALIGLAREYKKREKWANQKRKNGCVANPGCYKTPGHVGRCQFRVGPAFGQEVAEMMQEGDYFPADQAAVFGDALEEVLRNSDPRRIK